MAEENENQNVEDEMLRMMEAELGGAGDGEEDKTEDDFEAEMRRAIETESAGGDTSDDADAGGEDAAVDLEAEMLQAMMSETSASTPQEAQTAQTKAQSMLPGTEINAQNMHRLMDISLPLIIELGRTEQPMATLLEWSEGSLIELDRVSGDAVDVYINGKPFARGEVVTIAENFGVRITEILPYAPSGE